jgi:dethiobiotin synthase
VSAAILHRYRHLPVRYWKPIQTGIESDDDTADVRRLSRCDHTRVLDAGERLPIPVSPHLAARLNGSLIDIESLLAIATSASATSAWIVEGAGGLLVPVNERDLMVDLVRALGLPVVIVCRSGLGTINHTLLTIEALAHRSLPSVGVVLVGPHNLDNRQAIEQYGGARILGELPTFSPLSPETLMQWADDELDRGGVLAEYFE